MTIEFVDVVEVCKCSTAKECGHMVPLKMDPEKIQEGDLVKNHPTGKTLGVLGVDGETLCCDGPDGGLFPLVQCALVRKGVGISQFKMRLRLKTFGAGWHNEHALEGGDPEASDQGKPGGKAPAPLKPRKPKEAPPMEFGEPLGWLKCPGCKTWAMVVEVTNYPGQMFAKCAEPTCSISFRPGKYWADKLRPIATDEPVPTD